MHIYNYRHLVLLECALEKLDNSGSCVIPEQLTEHNTSCCITTKDVTFLAEKFQRSIAATSSDFSKLNEDCKTLRLLLQLINTISMQRNNLKVLQKIPLLLESTIGMYIVVIAVHYSLLYHDGKLV